MDLIISSKVYRRLLRTDALPLVERLRRYFGCGVWAGKLFLCIVVVNALWFAVLEYLYPRSDIDIAPGIVIDVVLKGRF
jgi:phosphatidylinositol glycan class A protein